jgi:enoyl-[acyl-carrier protein] reductase II
MKRTRVNKLFGIEYPIIQGGMALCSEADLVSAVSNAGGLGLLGLSAMSPEQTREQIGKAKQLTKKPFGVNLPLLRRDFEELLTVILEEGVKIVFSSAGNPALVVPKLKKEGLIVTHVISNVKQAKKALEAGCDAVVAEGFEAGGHDGPDELTTLTLTPQVVDAVGDKIPVISAGGIADARGIVAAFALGAEGVQLGTRFIATVENNAHNNFKNAIVQAEDTSTIFIARKHHPARVLKTLYADKIKEVEDNGADREKIKELTNPYKNYLGVIEGNIQEGLLNCGQSAGLIKSILPVRQVIKELVDGVDKVMHQLEYDK